MIGIHPFREEHVQAAIELTRHGAILQRKQAPALPPYHLPSETTLLRCIQGIPSFVAFDNDRFVGFLTGIPLANLHGYPAVYSPEWAHGALAGFPHLYAAAAGEWQSAGYVNHTLTTLAHHAILLRDLQWQGFGGIVVDAVTSLEDVDGSNPEVEIRLAHEEDVQSLTAMSRGLVDHLAASPILLRYPYITEERWQAILKEPDRMLFIARIEGRDVGYLKMGPCADDVCTVVRAQDTASISGAYCLPEFRCRRVMRSLLQAAIVYARKSGKYARLGVDWESNNVAATDFWTRHFTPVAISVRRIVPLATP